MKSAFICKSGTQNIVQMVKKKNGTTCFCGDYHKLNEVIGKIAYQLSHMDKNPFCSSFA